MYDTRGTKTCTIQEEQKHVRYKTSCIVHVFVLLVSYMFLFLLYRTCFCSSCIVRFKKNKNMYDSRGTKTCTIQEEQKHVRYKRNKNMYDTRGTKTCMIQEEQKHVRYKKNKNMLHLFVPLESYMFLFLLNRTCFCSSCIVHVFVPLVRYKRNKNMYNTRGTKTCTIQEEQKHV
jgi:hypothetical protein